MWSVINVLMIFKFLVFQQFLIKKNSFKNKIKKRHHLFLVISLEYILLKLVYN